MDFPMQTFSRVITCRGARVAERRLIQEIEGQLSSGAEGLALPVRVVVPSRSLRHHLLRTIARHRGAVAGLSVQTLYGLALEILARTDAECRTGDAGFEVVVRRLAAVQPSLQTALGQLVDGYDAVVGAVRDLLDAGFQPGNEEGVIERLDDVAEEVAPERIERARALVRLGTEVIERCDELGVWRPTHVMQLAEDSIRAHGPEVLPTRALLIHGFADVTGVATDLLVALVQIHRGVVILDRPPDPVEPAREDAGSVFLTRIEERLAHLDQVEDGEVDGSPEIRLAEASDIESEARWIADRVRALIEAGVEPEEIGVVSRDLERLSLPVRRHFRRLGVPFSGCGAAVPGASLRRILNRLADLLRVAEGADVDLWIEARGNTHGRTELLLGLRVLGLLRISDVAKLGLDGVPAGGVTLPVAVSDEEEDGDGDERKRRVLPAKALERAVADAARLLSSFEQWPEAADPDDHRENTLGVLDALGWSTDSPERERACRCFDALARELPSDFEITRGEWLKLVSGRLFGAGEIAVGGRGAGIQLLSVMEARARTFTTLFIADANRGVFPRVVHEDPMLPEAVRVRLAADVLPEMPVKGRSADEERYLFAQLLSSAPDIRLSWHLYGADGTLTPSPFIDRLRLGEGVASPETAPQLWPLEDASLRKRPAYEIAVLAAPRVDRNGFEKLLGAAISDDLVGAGEEPVWFSNAEFAAARADVVAAAEPPPGSEAPGPWFGFAGSIGRHTDDPMWVTRLEATGTCPWRAFIEQRLGIFPLPDPRLGLPGVDGMLVGQVVHAVLEGIVRDAIREPPDVLDEALTGLPVEVSWPSPVRLEEMVRQEARRVAFREGLATIGMAPLLEARARQFLDVAHAVEWAGADALVGVLAPEVEGAVSIHGVVRPLAFRADRVDGADGGTELVDYKAARPLSTAKKDTTRASYILDRIAKGRVLQAAAYAVASGGRGRYVYLKPDDRWGDEVRNVVISGDDEQSVRSFEAAVQAIAYGRARGIAFPRLEEADGRSAEHCRYCRVAEACRRDDSGFRRRLVEWMRRDGASDHPDEGLARGLWWLGVDREGADT
jgi:hypothetical protein